MQTTAGLSRFLCMLGLVAAMGMSGAATARAQTPPTAAEYAIYEGLFEAAAKGLASRIDELAEAGADPNMRDENGRTPLMVAVFRQEGAAAKALLDAGANPNLLDNESYDALTLAASDNNLALVKVLLAGGANARAMTGPLGGTALMAAVQRGHARVVEALVAARAPVNHVNNLGASALVEAITHGDGGERYQKIVDVLIRAEADLDLADRAGIRPLALARQKAQAEVASLLEKAGARP